MKTAKTGVKLNFIDKSREKMPGNNPKKYAFLELQRSAFTTDNWYILGGVLLLNGRDRGILAILGKPYIEKLV